MSKQQPANLDLFYAELISIDMAPAGHYGKGLTHKRFCFNDCA
jgi:hypothetical protein